MLKPTPTPLRRAAFALTLLLWAAFPLLAADTKPQPDIRALIENAVATGQRRLVIPPGVYRIGPKANEGVIITVRNARNLEIVADGVTMVCTKRMRALMFDRCENVTLRGLTVDYDPLTFTQGKVVAIAEDKGWIDIRLDAGYPRILFDRIVICDPKTRFHKYGIDHLWGTKASWAAPDTVRITRKDVGRNVDPGDPVALSGGQEAGTCHGITVENRCADIVFRNVTLHCAPGMGIVDFDGVNGLRMYGCRIVPGPRPADATEERLLTTSWDGIQCNVARTGARVEDCVIERCGDDSWSVTNREMKVVRRDGRVLLLSLPDGSPRDGGLRAGDRLLRRSDDGAATQTVQAAQSVQREIDGKMRWLVEATLSGDMAVDAGQYVSNPDCSSKGFVYRNNRIYSHGRGALVKASDGVIEGNTFRGGDKAIVVNPEWASGGSDRLVIRNNKIVETGYHQAMPWSEQAGALCLSSSKGGGKLRPPGAFNDILIENNTFDRVKGLNLFISSARNVTVQNNRFRNTHTTDPGRHNGADYGIAATAVIEVTESDGVKFTGNVIERMGPFARQAAVITPSARDVTPVESGVRVLSR